MPDSRSVGRVTTPEGRSSIDHSQPMTSNAGREPVVTAQPFENAPQQPATTQPEPECPPASTGPQTGTQPLELWQVWADGYLAAQRGDAETTNPYAETCPTCGGHGMVMDWGGAADCPNDCWHGMVPAEPCDDAPIALDKIRARLDKYTDMYGRGSIIPGGVISDLYAILDTAKEPR